MILAARQIVGDVEYDLIKISLDGKKLSFLRYPDFDDIAHPELAYSVRVYLPTASYGIKHFSNSENPTNTSPERILPRSTPSSLCGICAAFGPRTPLGMINHILRISRMKASILFVILARLGPKFCSRQIPLKNVMIKPARESLSSRAPCAAARLSMSS
jgi:hypothetical protein